jgi:hypothetical protein
VAEVRERLAVINSAGKRIDMERFNLKKLSEGEVNGVGLQSQTSLQPWKT